MNTSTFTLASIALLLATSDAHAQDTIAVYSLGGEASPEEYAAALGSVTTALRAAGREPVAAEAHCDPDHLCFADVLQANECDAAAVVTYWAQSETRELPHIVITLADTTGLVEVAEDIPAGAVLTTTAAEMIRSAFYDWPRRAGVILHLDTIPSGRPVRIDGVMLQSPVTRPMILGRHEVIVGAEGLIRRDFSVHGESEAEIRLIVRLDDESDIMGPIETDPETESPMESGEGSAWPSYAFGGGLVVAGAALWISPVLTLAGVGDLKTIDGAENVERVAIDGGQVALMVAGSVLAIAGVTFIAGGWLRGSANVSTDGASLILEGQF